MRDGCTWEAMKGGQAWLGMLPGVGWLLRERRHNKRKRDERGRVPGVAKDEWKMQFRGLPSVGFEATQ